MLNLRDATSIELYAKVIYGCACGLVFAYSHELAGRGRNFIKKTLVGMLEEEESPPQAIYPISSQYGITPHRNHYCFTGLSDGAVSISFAWLLCNLVACTYEKSHLNIYTELLSHCISSNTDLTLSHWQSLSSAHWNSKSVCVEVRYFAKGFGLSKL